MLKPKKDFSCKDAALRICEKKAAMINIFFPTFAPYDSRAT